MSLRKGSVAAFVSRLPESAAAPQLLGSDEESGGGK